MCWYVEWFWTWCGIGDRIEMIGIGDGSYWGFLLIHVHGSQDEVYTTSNGNANASVMLLLTLQLRWLLQLLQPNPS